MSTIGIIECGKNRSEWISEHADFADWFPPFLNLADSSINYKVYKALLGELPKSLLECDAWLLTGSPVSVYDDNPWQTMLADFLIEAVKVRPVIGICYGHQLLHQILGGVVGKADGWGIGVQSYDIQDTPVWAPQKNGEDPLAAMRLIALHQDQVVTPAPDSRILAGNSFCPVGITTIGENVFSIQAHPEMTPALARAIYEFHRHDAGTELTDQALPTLASKIDNVIAAQWIVAFVQDRLKNSDCRQV